MPRFFVLPEQIDFSEGLVSIVGDDAVHISRSLRMAVGEKITVCDTQGNEYECSLCDFSAVGVSAKIISSGKSNTEPPYEVRLYQALPKGDKLDFIIQKAVECGVTSVRTFESSRCVAHAKSDSEERKLARRNKIALEAAKQCGRGIVPEVLPIMDFASALNEASEYDISLFCYEGEGTESLKKLIQNKVKTLDSTKGTTTISVVIGSEGGFSAEEAMAAAEKGFLMVGLGKRILRTETASSFVLGCLVYEFEL